MRIIGFSFKKIQAERKKDIKGQLKINSNLNIENIEKDKIDIAGEILKFSYIYEIKYEPGFGEILFKGEILVIPDNIQQTIKDWKKKKISEETRIPLFNYIMSKCNLKALQLEEDSNLPAHIPLPRLTKQQNQQGQSSQADYTG